MIRNVVREVVRNSSHYIISQLQNRSRPRNQFAMIVW